MKKLLLAFILMCTFILPSNAVVFAARTTCEVNLEGAYYEMSDGSANGEYPTLNISLTGDSLNAMSFHLVLDGADWDVNKMSNIDSNIQVTNSSSKDIQLKFTREFFKSGITAISSFSIPLYAKNFRDGYTYLTITDTPSYMSGRTFLFACNIAAGFAANYSENAEIYRTGVSTLSDIMLIDSSSFSAVSGETVFRINISDSTFAITDVPEITGTGKFESIVYGELLSSSTLAIKVSEDSESGSGNITVKNLTLNRSAEKHTSSPDLVVYSSKTITFSSNEGEEITRKIEKRNTFSTGTYYDKKSSLSLNDILSSADDEQADDETDEASSYEGSEGIPVYGEISAGNVLSFTVNDDGYILNGERYDISSPCIVFDGRTLLPLRALSTALGIDDENIVYDAETKTVVIAKNGKQISIEQNGDYMYVNGLRIEVTTPAVNYNGSLYLPVRDICSALGIADSDIYYDAETKTVTIVFE